MTLIVEDGTGLVDGESYLSLVTFKAYCDGRGMDYAGSTDAVLEQKLRIATGYIDTVKRYKGQRLLASQALEFPRESLTDFGGLAVTGVPKRVKDACAELAFKAISANLYTDLDRGGMVQSESVGPISVSYMEGAPAGMSFTSAMKLLEPYFKDPNAAGAPYFAPVSDPYFSLTTDDFPGTSPSETVL